MARLPLPTTRQFFSEDFPKMVSVNMYNNEE